MNLQTKHLISVFVILGVGFILSQSAADSPTGKFYQNVEGQEPSFEESYREYRPSEEERMMYESQREEYQPTDEERARYETMRENYEPTAEELARRKEMMKKYESMSEDRRNEFESYGPSEAEMKMMKEETEKRKGFFSRWFGGGDEGPGEEFDQDSMFKKAMEDKEAMEARISGVEKSLARIEDKLDKILTELRNKQIS